MACVKLSTERIVAPERPASAKGGMGKTVKGLFKNKPLITILFAFTIIHDVYDVNWCG